MADLSKYITEREFTRSATAARLGIKNELSAAQRLRAEHLCQNFVDPIRAWFGVPLAVTSGLRTKKLNDAVPGSSDTSEHMTGGAVDFTVSGVSLEETCALISIFPFAEPYDQLIHEFGDWVHLGVRPGKGRKQDLLINAKSGGYKRLTAAVLQRAVRPSAQDFFSLLRENPHWVRPGAFPFRLCLPN